jgi:hypothetical protein
MSSMMRRRRGLISVSGASRSRVGVKQPNPARPAIPRMQPEPGLPRQRFSSIADATDLRLRTLAAVVFGRGIVSGVFPRTIASNMPENLGKHRAIFILCVGKRVRSVTGRGHPRRHPLRKGWASEAQHSSGCNRHFFHFREISPRTSNAIVQLLKKYLRTLSPDTNAASQHKSYASDDEIASHLWDVRKKAGACASLLSAAGAALLLLLLRRESAAVLRVGQRWRKSLSLLLLSATALVAVL